jgi:hypothetical protein
MIYSDQNRNKGIFKAVKTDRKICEYFLGFSEKISFCISAASRLQNENGEQTARR